jgi:outer membrane protein OmpA-like peptidoglycan-associated protein
MIRTYLQKKIFPSLVICLFAAFNSCPAQIRIDTSLNAVRLVKDILLGEGVAVSNVKYTGSRHAIASYQDSSKILSIQNGLLLTTGNALMCSGPNNFAGMGWVSKSAGSRRLDSIAAGDTYDAAVLEFDFVTSAEVLTFNFIFASEEYKEYVGSKYNDVFGFFVSGPGMPNINLATLPRSRTPVTINSINHKTNRKYYVDNPTHTYNDRIIYDVRRKKTIRNKDFRKASGLPKYDLQYDGFTTVLEASCKLIPGEVYHIEIAIADVGDYSLDSGVFLEAKSFRSLGGSYVSSKSVFDKTYAATPEMPPAPVFSGNKSAIAELEPIQPEKVETRVFTGRKPAAPVSYRVEFAFDSFAIGDSAAAVLQKVCQEIRNSPSAVVELVGHTDFVGPDAYNDQLSRRRAQAVASYLQRNGANARLVEDFKGERIPAQTNETDDGRARNRRTEIILKWE